MTSESRNKRMRCLWALVAVACTLWLSVIPALSADATIRWQSRDRDPVGGVDVNEIIVRMFEERNPGIKVEYAATSGSELPVQLIGGAAPDVIDNYGSRMRDLIVNNLLLDLNPYLETLLPGDDRNDFFAPQVAAFEHNGSLYALPKYLGTIGLYYNIGMFETSGVAFPDERLDWQGLIAMGKKLTRVNAQGEYTQRAFYKGAGMAGSSSWIMSNGGRDFIDGDRSRSAWAEPRAIETLQYLADLRHVHNVWTGTRSQWERGQVAIAEDGLWRLTGWLSQVPFQFNITHTVKGPVRRVSRTTSDGYGLAWHTQQPKEAIAFLKFLVGPEANRVRLQYYGRQPARRSMVAELRRTMLRSNPDAAHIDFNIYQEVGSYAFPEPLYSDPQRAEAVINAALTRIFDKNEPASKVMQEVIPALNAELQQKR